MLLSKSQRRHLAEQANIEFYEVGRESCHTIQIKSAIHTRLLYLNEISFTSWFRGRWVKWCDFVFAGFVLYSFLYMKGVGVDAYMPMPFLISHKSLLPLG